MALELKTQIRIEASSEEVWQVLTDFETYSTWNPFIKSIKGNVAEGERIKVHIEGMKFKPKVLAFTKGKELVWLGHFLFKGLVDGKHSFVLVENADGSTTLEHSESFSGILVPLFKKKLMEDTKAGFERMNVALKQRVEKVEMK